MLPSHPHPLLFQTRYLTACANDFCRESKRQTISAQDVMQAIKELEFGELEEPLKEYLDQVLDIAEVVWLTWRGYTLNVDLYCVARLHSVFLFEPHDTDTNCQCSCGMTTTIGSVLIKL
ncbi:unnamed protein product [Choristocarpus tenellus]